MRKLLVSLLAILLMGAVASCGASGGSDASEKTTTTDGKTATTEKDETTTTEKKKGGGDDGAYADAIATGLSGQSDGEFVFNNSEAECVAPEWVDIIGTDTFESKSVKPADLEDPDFKFSSLGLDEGQASDMIDAIEGCDVDVVSELRDLIDADLDSDQKACAASELDDETIREVLEQSIYLDDPSTELQDELDRIDAKCGLSDSEAPSSGTVPTASTIPGG